MDESARMREVQAPIIPIIGDLARSTPGTISLGQGVTFYGPPPEATARIESFLSDPNNHKYQAVEGVPELREAIARKLKADNGVCLDERSIVVTAGANMGFQNAVQAIADPGDEIILLTPWYFNHEMAVRICSCKPVEVLTDEVHQPSVGAIEAAISGRTRAVVTVSPNNPAGTVYPEEMLRAINDLCRARGVFHIHDEAYEYFTYDGATHVSAASFPDSAPHTISLYSLSKSYGFASWRIGYMVIPASLLTAVKKIQDTNLICPPVVSQFAAVGAMEAGAAYCRGKLETIARVRGVVLEQLRRIEDICTVPTANGAFYFLLHVDSDLEPLDAATRLIREHGVAVIPGTAFGLPASECRLRISYGPLDEQTASEGIRRLTDGLRAIAGC